MWNYVEYLKQPILVAQFQSCFGIKDKNISTKEDEIKKEINQKNYFSDDNTVSEKLKNKNGVVLNESENYVEDFVIENKFWYYLFLIGTTLGDEIFYASFIPFWFWNIDGAVGRRVVLVWTIIMYIGQRLKNIIKWPRPEHPAKRLQKKWSEEYGMPSTHAMVAVSIPFSVIFYTMNRYIYSVRLGIFFAFIKCIVICASRIYFGMHTVLDIIVGLVLAFSLMLPILPTVDYLDHFWLSSPYSPAIILVISIAVIYFFPHSEKWTSTRSDTTMITSVCAGIQIGTWINFKLGNMTPYPFPPPYKIIWPNLYMLMLGLVRTVLGFTLVLATRNCTKSIATPLLSTIVNTTPDRAKAKSFNKPKKDVFVELATNFATYFLIGINIVYSIPIVFRFLGIERPTFYTEL